MSNDDLQGLLERLKEATGADQQINIALFRAFVPERERGNRLTPNYTGSIESALYLVERTLPGWAWKVGTCSVSDDFWLVPDFNCPTHGERLRKEFAAEGVVFGSIWDTGIDIDRRPAGQPALAVLQGLVAALIERERA